MNFSILVLSLCSLVLAVLLVKLDRRRRVLLLSSQRASAQTLKVLVLKSFLHRRIGLLNHVDPPEDAAVLLTHSHRVHTKGMLFSIDVVALTADYTVLEIITLPPGCAPLSLKKGTKHILEFAADRASAYAEVGQTLRLLKP